ncbi:MAG: metallophosphoesterase [Oscillospiraceae bacterium]|nr:metallophosphoesterase [Oscillospiraceae bacterium]
MTTNMIPELKITHVNIDPQKRILVTSDIHGHLSYLKNVLEKAEFSENDILIIVGDIVEKGPESLNTLRYVMKLCEKGNVIPLIGNVDAWRLNMINGICEESVQNFYDYILNCRAWYGTSFFDELTNELGFICKSPEDILESKEAVIRHFKAEFSFLSALPTVVETQNYVFVHGGLHDKKPDDNCKRKLFELLKYDDFMSADLCFDKYIVVGHWPVMLYGDKIAQSNPIINKDKRIISIDGGCGIKEYGQLNLLIIPGVNSGIESVYYVSYDDIPVYCALESQKESNDSISIRWINNEIKILEKSDDFTYVEHKDSGRKLWIPNSYIRDETHCRDYTDYALPVQKGDKLSLITETSKGYIVKKEGVTGWYYGKLKKV